MKYYIALLLCISIGVVYGQNLKVSFTSQLVIGGDKIFKKEYYFKRPLVIKCDSHNNIYVRDDNYVEIKKYDKNGKYIKTITRAGEGPGEFKYVKHLIVDEADNIIIVDPILFRLTTLSSDGKYIESRKIAPEFANVNRLVKYNKNSYVAFQEGNWDEDKHVNKAIIFDKEFKTIETSFAHSSIFWKKENAFEFNMDITSQLYMLPIKSEKVVISKEIYDGKIFVFDKKEGWKHKVTQGTIYKNVPYEIYDEKDQERVAKERRGYWIFTSVRLKRNPGPEAFLFWSHGAGLYFYNDKYILNFFTLMSKGKTAFGIDIFDINAKYLGYYEIKESGINPSLDSLVLCMDNEGAFYMTERTKEGIPIIRKFKLCITE